MEAVPRLTPTIAVLTAALAIAVAPTQARPTGDVGPRIVNGSPAQPGEWPSATYLLGTANGVNYWACGGSVIAPRVILTAAHCVANSTGTPAIAASSRARPGVLLSSDTSTQQAWSAVVAHPDYDRFTNDVALIELPADTAAPPMPLIAPWLDGLVTGGTEAAIAGWGMTDRANEASVSLQLRQAAVPIVSDAACSAAYGSDFQPSNMVCAADLPAGIDSCKGDSGGPLAITVAGTRRLIGDTSWGAFPCADGVRPGVYGRLSAFRSWLLAGDTATSRLVRDHVAAQTATAQDLTLTSTGSDVTLTWSVTPANWTTTGFRVTLNGSTETVTGPAAARSIAVPGGGPVSATVEPQVTLGTAQVASVTATPTPTRAPVVTGGVSGTAKAGSRVSAVASSDDPWGGAVAYQWLLNGADIAGATAAAYRPVAAQAGKALSVRVAAANAIGTSSITLAAGRVQRTPTVRRGRVAVKGRAVVGGRLTARAPRAAGYPRPKVTYRFKRNGRIVQTGRSKVYRVRKRDRGARITGTVTWRNSAGTVSRRLAAVRIAS